MKWIVLVFFSLVIGCDNREAPPPPPTAGSSTPQAAGIEVAAIAPLKARRRTHIAIDSRNNIYWTQEWKDGDEDEDIVFGASQGGIPEPIGELSTRRLLGKLKLDAGTGNIQSIVIGADDNLYAYFTGGKGATSVSAIFQYSTQTKALRVLVSTDQLMRDTTMGKSLALARGTLLASSTDIWLWVRNSDLWVLLRVIVPESLARSTELQRRFETIRVADRGVLAKGQVASLVPIVFKLTSDQEELSAGPNQQLYYVDRARGTLWQIDGKGVASVSHSLQGFPQAVLTAPIVDPKGQLRLFGGEGDLINSTEAGDEDPLLIGVGYPALLTFSGPKPSDTLSILSRNAMHADLNVQLSRIEPTAAAMEKRSESYIVFDGTSGQLLRLKPSGK